MKNKPIIVVAGEPKSIFFNKSKINYSINEK